MAQVPDISDDDRVEPPWAEMARFAPYSPVQTAALALALGAGVRRRQPDRVRADDARPPVAARHRPRRAWRPTVAPVRDRS
jgi:hypothetical protein